jgi:hypothetical protein
MAACALTSARTEAQGGPSMTENDYRVFANYLEDLGKFIKKEALDVREKRRQAVTEGDVDFLGGKLLAYNEVINLMQQEAIAFGLSLDAISLGDIDPDRDLVP